MKDVIKDITVYIFKSILAGIVIGIACMIYIYNQNVVGALLFSVGLVCIVSMNMKLYTGMVGQYKFDILLLVSLLANMLGTYLMALYTMSFRFQYSDMYIAIASEKLSSSLVSTFVMSIICGLLIFIGVRDFNINKRLFVLVACVVAFIMVGAEHCIADSFYMFCTGTFNLQMFIYLLVCVIGNTIGSYIGKLSVKYDK